MVGSFPCRAVLPPPCAGSLPRVSSGFFCLSSSSFSVGGAEQNCPRVRSRCECLPGLWTQALAGERDLLMVCVGLGVFSEPTALRADISWPAAASWWGRLSPGHRPGSSVLTVELVLGSDCAHLLASGTPPPLVPFYFLCALASLGCSQAGVSLRRLGLEG